MENTTLITIQDYQKFLGTQGIPTAEFESFSNAYHPWGNGWNVRLATARGLEWLKANSIRFAEWTEKTWARRSPGW